MSKVAQENVKTLDVADAPAQADQVVRVDKVSVQLSLQRSRVSSIREYLIRVAKGQRIKSDKFWPLKEVSFDVKRGEAVGIVGPNGAGKSTLLRVIAGILRPTIGTVRVKGRIAPLIELGAGFDPEMTGRENIFLYGSMLGFSTKRLTSRLSDIVSFSELEEFLDVPIKNYSSGMTARLAFAVATDVDPDVLLIDELLSVGDAAFQKKCEDRITDFRKRGVSILLVSHNPKTVVNMCSRVVWLDHGKIVMVGPAAEVVDSYSIQGA